MLDSITPLILTLNEARNIERTLSKLNWAKDIVIVDSFSSDETLELAEKYPQVRIFQRNFDTHADQWNFGLEETGISTEWVLALDADYVLSDELVEELKRLAPGSGVHGYRASFVYCIKGKTLRGTVYPPVTVLYRKNNAIYDQDAHTQRIRIKGPIFDLKAPIYHDDRKPFNYWLQSQKKYMKLEAEKLLSIGLSQLSWPDRLRRFYVIAPIAIFVYCLFFKGTALDGKAGVYYAFQRMLAEGILSLFLLQSSFGEK